MLSQDSTFLCIFGKLLAKPIAVVNRIHKQALKTAVFLAFSVYSEVYKAVFSPTASSLGNETPKLHGSSSSFI
ncbi:MAG: hypothetical protein IJB02_06735 [Oscillospiraceae bacterium]|nr:hypothetical protein [Oscillospiraceae bacterium]